ncbi:MAG TPA: CPBP family glutamic-type intramembrane protease [Anaerolineae bacterium]|nr:CPBP family glutamic-type intramembrane protease [Anaerolineae bacterium]
MFSRLSSDTNQSGVSLPRKWLGEQQSLLILLFYLLLITIGELLTISYPFWGLLVHVALLVALLLHAGFRWETKESRLILTLVLAPMVRIVSFGLPPMGLNLIYYIFIASLPLFVATFMILNLLQIRWVWPKRMNIKQVFIQLLIAGTGCILGVMEYYILRPQPLYETFSLVNILLPGAILFLSTGLLEELVFRRMMQEPAINYLGIHTGIWYIAAIFAVLHIGYASVLDVVFVMSVGVMFGYFVLWTDSIIGVTLAHGLTNSFLFLIMPFVAIEYGIGPQPSLPLNPIDPIPIEEPIGNPEILEPVLTTPLNPTPTSSTLSIEEPSPIVPATITPIPTATPTAYIMPNSHHNVQLI